MPFLEANGAKLYYVESGSGEPIMLIPGLGLDHNYYRLAIPSLSKAMTVFAVDPRGIGQSSKLPHDYSVEFGPMTLRL